MTAEEILKKSPTANTEGLTGLAAFIAGETVQRDEEAAALTRAKVRQAIDEMGRIAMPDPLRRPPANAQQAELDYWRARALRAEGEVITADAEKEAACAVLATVAEYIDNGVRPPMHVDIDGLYARMRDAVNGWRNGGQP